jgi:alpha-2-macroglobulin
MRFIPLLLSLGLFVQMQAVNISAKVHKPAPNDKQLTFTLSKNIFDASLVGSYTHEKLLSCTPAINGAYEFTQSNAITIYPSHPLQANSDYSCQLAKSTYTKADTTRATFHTENLYAVIERFGKMISIHFNTHIELNELKNALTISRKNKLSESRLSFEITSSKDKQHYLALIKEDISRNDLAIVIKSSLSTVLENDITQMLSHKQKERVIFDPKRKTMTLTGQPRYIAQNNGKLAIRLYLPHYFYSSTPIRSFISIKGMDNFSVGSPNYLYSDEKRKYNIPKENERYVDISGDFKSGQTYEITVKSGLKDGYNYQLRHDTHFKVTMGDRKKYIGFDSDKPYLSSAGEVGISSVNTKKATIVVEHLMDQNYRYFITFTGGESSYVQSMATEVGRKSFNLEGKKNIFSKHKIDIKAFMKDFKSGVYRLTIHYNGSSQTSKSVYFSDIGITTKVANDQLLVWATKLSDSTPIDDAEVKIYSAKNELLSESETNDNGVAIIDKKAIADKRPKSIVVSTNNEQSFLYLSQTQNGVYTPFHQAKRDKYKTFIYYQSKLIRPGNDAHILMLLKDSDYLAGSNLPLKVTITDPTGQKLYSEVLQTSEHGSIDLKYFVDESFKTGTYRLQVKLGNDTIGSSSFSVENFIPQKIKNSITFKEKSLEVDQLLHTTIGSRYLFGAPGSDLKATARLTAVSKVYHCVKHKGYSFNNELLAKNNASNYLLRNKTLKLNKKGEANIIFDTKISQNPPSMLQAQMALTVFDDGRGVSTYKKIDLFPYKTMVGVKILDSSIEKGDEIQAQTLVLNPKTEQEVTHKLEVLVKKYSWDYYYDNSGYYKWHKRYTDVERFYIPSGETIKLTMPNSGDYTLIVSDHLSGHSTTKNFRVSGWDYTPIDPTSNMGKVQVNIDKKLLKAGFNKGDTVHVDIKSPLVKGHMLLTLEGKKVLWSKVIEIEKGVASLDIDLDFEMPYGLYLRTHMIRATDTPSLLIPFRASSVTYLKPNKTALRQDVRIITPKLSSSNRTQEIKVMARPHSSVIVSVVDEGILQIKGQKSPKPFMFFERQIQEQIALFDLYDKVMHYQTKGTLLSFGSDGSAKMKRSRKHLGPKTGAKRVKPFVYWSKVVQTNSNGEVTVTLPIPAFNGQAQIVAIAYNKNSVGTATQELVIKDDIIIKPTFSRFIYIGDELIVPVRLFNTAKEVKNITLQAQTSDQLKMSLDQSSLTLRPNSSQLIHAKLKALAFGKGEVKIIAKADDKSFFSEVELPVTSAYALQTKVYKGETSKDAMIQVDKKYFSDTPTKLFMTLSDSYLSQLKGSVNALIGYPYGCAEQTSSKLLGMLYIDKFIKGSSDQHTKDLLNDRKRFIQEGIYKLHGMQKHSGEFGYWRSSGYINPYASIYASDVILELERQGFDIPNDMINKTYKALRNQAKGYGNYRYGSTSYFERMYASYLLSKEKQLTPDLANSLYDQKIYTYSLVTRYMMAAILKEANLSTPLQQVFAELEQFHLNRLSQQRLLGGSFYSKSRNLAFALYLHVSHFHKNNLSKKLLEHLMRESKNIYSTQDKAFMMRAMVANYKDAVDEPMKAELIYNGKVANFDKAFSTEDSLKSQEIMLKAKKGIVNYAFEVSNYVQKPLRHMALHRQNTAVKIVRDYVDEKGSIINPSHLNIGDLFYSKITLQSAKKLKNLVVSDRIPACFEIVNERLSKHSRSNYIKNSSNFKPDYRDYQDNQTLSFLNLDQPRRKYNRATRSYINQANTQTFYQAMRVLSKGTCQFPAVVVEAMYDGRITAYDKEYRDVTINDKNSSIKQAPSSSLKHQW